MSLRYTELRQLLELVSYYTEDGNLEASYEDVISVARRHGALGDDGESLSLASAVNVIYTMVREHEKQAIQSARASETAPAYSLGGLPLEQRGDHAGRPGHPSQLPG
jgi:hypothetical protein